MSNSARDQKTSEEQSERIVQLERRCEDQVVRRTEAETARLTASGDTLTQLEIKNARSEGDREISNCQAEADRENGKIVQRNIASYQAQQQEERDRGALMATLTASRIH